MGQREEEFQIVEAVLNGQNNRYRELIDRHAPMVFHITNRFVDHADDAEELAQEIFVKAYERLSSFDKNSRFSSWLYVIAKNHCRDYVKNIRRKNIPISKMDPRVLERKMRNDKGPDAELERKEREHLLKEGLVLIKEEHATAFLMKYRSNMTYKTISQRLGVSVSAAKLRVYRAKKELKKFIEENS